MPELPLVLTVEEAAKALRISRGSAYEAIRTNEIPHVRIGRTIRVPRAALLTLLGDDPANGSAEPSQLADGSQVERDGRRGGAGEPV
jgi:excisionase family DNA binding protein